jgi:cell division protein ZapA
MSEAVVQLKIAGQSYRVITSASTEDVGRLAARVEETLRSVTAPGRQPGEQSMVLAAITLAHDLEEERRARRALEARYEAKLEQLLGMVNAALGQSTAPDDSMEREFGRIAPTLPPPTESDPEGTLDLPFVGGFPIDTGLPSEVREVYVGRPRRELEAVGSDG